VSFFCIPAALSSQDASRFAVQASRDSAISANSSCLAHPRAPPNASTPRTLDHASKGKFLHCLKRREEKSSVKNPQKEMHWQGHRFYQLCTFMPPFPFLNTLLDSKELDSHTGSQLSVRGDQSSLRRQPTRRCL
jgi:hypothetical protein